MKGAGNFVKNSAPWLKELKGIEKLDLQDPFIRLVTGGFLAYAAGDAFGVPFEFAPRRKVEEITLLEKKDGWPLGGVSDDTLLSLLTIQALKENDNSVAAVTFLSLLRSQIPNLRGLGPTTRAALGLPVKESERESIGNTNGAMMRTSLVGLAFNSDRAKARRDCVTALVKVTHTKQPAIDCALALSAAMSLASNMNGKASLIQLNSAVIQELKEIDSELLESFIDFNPISWSSPNEGIPLNPVITLKAVLFTVAKASDCASAYSIACSLGGDTDTVAALSGSLYCVWQDAFYELIEIPWLQEIDWAELETLSDSVQVINAKRNR